MDSYSLHAIWMLVEIALLAGVTLWLFKLRERIGSAFFYVAIAVLHSRNTELASQVEYHIAPGLIINSASAVYFSAKLWAVLLIYIREDAAEARQLLYGLVLGSSLLAFCSAASAAHLAIDQGRWLTDMAFIKPLLKTVFSESLLLLDALLLIVIYEWIATKRPAAFFLRVYVALAITLSFDQLIYYSLYLRDQNFLQIMLGGMVGKWLSALIFTSILTAWFARQGRLIPATGAGIGARVNVFERLSYKQRFERLQQTANRDALTGLYNRAYFDRVLRDELEHSRKYARPLALILLDVDHFKRINDEFGHPAGDSVLRDIGELLQSQSRAQDSCCRYGGEELALVLPNTTPSDALHIGQRLQQQITAHFQTTRAEFGTITATFGLAFAPQDALEADGLIRRADRRLYAGKKAGRNRLVAVA
jgi:diguanylate cyclase (GGDEF)-like protein